jgi:hypothetical protein
MPVPDRATFESAYVGQAPWDIGRPQQAFLDVADRITGSILDAGCGTGDNALFFASRGHKVSWPFDLPELDDLPIPSPLLHDARPDAVRIERP